jgi:small ligand-binding sensory domain FIST
VNKGEWTITTPPTPFRVAHAVANDWAHAVKACTDTLGHAPLEGNLGFVFVTDTLCEDLSSILTYLRQRTGIDHWVGSVGLGICAGGNEYFDIQAMSVMVASVPEEDFHIFPSITNGVEELSKGCRDWIARTQPSFGMVHGDPGNEHSPDLIEAMAETSGGFLVGGMTSSRESCLQIAGRVTGGGLSGILFAPTVAVATGLTQGCSPIAGEHVISDCLENVVVGLDGHRALDVFKEDIGNPLAEDVARVAGLIHAGLPVEGSDMGDYLVRELVGIDPVRGWLAIGDTVHPGDRLVFVRRDGDSAEQDLRGMLEKLKRRLDGPPRGGIYYSCIGRGPHLFGGEGRETGMIHEVLGDFPLTGFYAGGEISNGRLYTHTGVLSLFL